MTVEDPRSLAILRDTIKDYMSRGGDYIEGKLLDVVFGQEYPSSEIIDDIVMSFTGAFYLLGGRPDKAYEMLDQLQKEGRKRI